MQYLWAFLVGGALCAIGQLLIDLTTVSYTHLTLPTKLEV